MIGSFPPSEKMAQKTFRPMLTYSDICHHMKIEDADNLIRKMNGKKYLIVGNHDKKYDPRLFEDIKDFMKISVEGRNFALMHYPMLS